MTWKKFEGNVVGTRVEGDPSVPPTRWYNHLWLLMFGWKKVAVFMAMNASAPARVGFRPFRGDAMLREEPLDRGTFRVRIGHEACTFFVVGDDGKEIPLELLKVTTRDDPGYDKVPLL